MEDFTNDPTKGYYCANDGGQWNVLVSIENTAFIGYFVIKGRELLSACVINGEGYLCAKFAEVHAKPQSEPSTTNVVSLY